MLKQYYSLDDAAEYLSGASGTPIQNRDIFDMARRGMVKLCVYVSRRHVTLCNLFGEQCRIDAPDRVAQFAMQYLDGYIELVAGQIDRATNFPIRVDQVYRIREEFDPKPPMKILTKDGRLIDDTRESFQQELGEPCLWSFCKHETVADLVDSATTGNFLHDELLIQEADILIPAEDLLHFRRGSKLTTRPDESTVELTGKARATALRLIGGLLMAGYGMDIHAARLAGSQQVLDDLAGAGVTVDDKTLRTWIKEAAQVIEPHRRP